MVGMAVHLDRPPHSARLLAWGRAPHGWWGLVTFRHRVAVRGDPAELPVAAWVPASSLRQPSWSARVELPRLALPDDQGAWPAPQGWPSWYAGPWPNGPLALPPGVEIIVGPAWRTRR